MTIGFCCFEVVRKAHLLKGVGISQVVVFFGCLGDIVIRIRRYFQLIEIVLQDISHHAIGGFVCPKYPCAGVLEPHLRVFIRQTQQTQTGVVGLLLKDFGFQYVCDYLEAIRADFSGAIQEILG